MTQPKIPETFLTVVIKMNPEISNIEIENFDVIKIINPLTFNLDERIKVIVNLHMNREHKLKGPRNTYSELLNTLFNYTYPDHEFISFAVSQISYPPEKTNMEKFHELFYTKQV
jgi:hypothetical protein